MIPYPSAALRVNRLEFLWVVDIDSHWIPCNLIELNSPPGFNRIRINIQVLHEFMPFTYAVIMATASVVEARYIEIEVKQGSLRAIRRVVGTDVILSKESL